MPALSTSHLPPPTSTAHRILLNPTISPFPTPLRNPHHLSIPHAPPQPLPLAHTHIHIHRMEEAIGRMRNWKELSGGGGGGGGGCCTIA